MEPNNSPHRSGHGSLQHPYPHRAASSPHLLSHSPSRPLPPHFGAGSRPSSRASSPPPHSSSPASFMSQQGSIVTGGIFAQGESALGNDLATYLQRNFEPNPAPAAPRSPVHISCCCGDSDCENMQLFTTTVRGLEDEVRLAGEIGQALLHRHETLVKEHDNTLIENEETKASFQRQLASKKQEIQSLQQLAEHMGLANRELQEDRDRAVRDVQRAEKNLKALTIDLETTQARLTNAVAESEARGNEIDKLGVFKIMVKAGMEKEEGLRTKLDDAKQELSVARKNETSLEARYKKMKGRYDTLNNVHEKLKREFQELMATGEKYKDLAWLKESNEKLRNDVIKLTSPFKPPLTDPRQMHNNHLINLIKELAAANNKLKSDLVEYKEMLSDSRNELHSLRSKVEEMENGDPTASIKTASSIAGTAASSRHGSPTGSVTPTADEFAGMLPNVKHSLMVEQQQSLAFLSSSAPQPTSMMMFGAAAVGRLSPDLERSKSRERSTREGSRERPITPVDRIRSRRSIDVISAAAAQLANEPSTPSSSVPTTPSTPTFNRTARPGPISITTVPLSSSSTSTSATGIGSAPHSPLGSPSVVHHHHHHYHYHVHRRKGSMQLDPNAPPGAAGALGGVHGNDDETETVEIVKEEVVVKMQPGTHSAPVSRASSPSRPADFQEGGRRVGFVVEKLHGMAGESPPAIKKTAVGSPSLLSASLASLGKDKGLGSAIIVPGGGDNERRVTIGFPEPTASSSDTVSGGHARRPSTADGKRRDMGIGYFAPPFNQIGGDGERRGRGFGSWREPIVTRVTVVGVSEDELAERMRDAATSPISEFNRQLPAPGGEGLAGRRGSQAKVQQSGKRGTAPLPLALSAPSMSRMFATPPPASPRGSIASQSSSASGGGGLQNPYVALHNLGANLLERLRGTDIRALNRRLKRTFDILELSGMSNSIIENVLSDVEVLRERFRWVEEAWKDKEAAAGADGTTTPNNAKTEEGGGKEKERERERERKLEALLAGVSVDEFLPLLHMVQDLLGEVGKLRMTVNDLQVEYVKKVEENQRWVEEGIVRRAERRAARHHEGWEGGGVTAGAGKFAWLASVLVGYRGRTGKNGRGPAWNPWRPAMLRTAADDHRGRNTDRRVGKHTQSMDRNQGQGERKGHVRSVSHDSVTSMLLDRQDTEGSGTHNGGSASDSMNGTNSSSTGTVPTPTSPVSRGRPPHRDLISAATTTVKVSAMDVPNTGNRRWSDSSLVAEGKGKGKGKGKEGDELIPGTGYKGATSYLSSSVFEEKGSQWRGGGMAGTEAANTTLGAKYGPPPGHFSSAARAISEKRRLRLSEQSMNSNSRRDEDENKDAVSPKATPSQILSSPTAPTQPPQRTSTITITTPSSPRALYPRTSNIPISPQPGGSAPRSRNMPIPRGSSSTPIRNQRGRSRDPGDARAADGSWRSRPPSPDADQDPTWKAGSMFAAGWMGTK